MVAWSSSNHLIVTK